MKSYNFLANSEVTVDNMDDVEEFKSTVVRDLPPIPFHRLHSHTGFSILHTGRFLFFISKSHDY